MRRTRLSLFLVLLLAPHPGYAENGPLPGGRLEFADKIRLITCDPASKTPGFRLKVNVVDGRGEPLDTVLPLDNLARNITITADNQQITAFYAAASSRRGRSLPRPRIVLVLMDTSGSMNERLPGGQTRFGAARAAAEILADGFIEGSDRIAVASFASRDVVSGIRNSPFARTTEELRREIESLPEPLPRNNTALYTAVETGIDILKEEGRVAGNDAELLLLTMTDGANDVREGDDPGLLEGLEGLAAAAQHVRESGIQAIGVGFGDPASIDESALRQISTQTYLVEDPAELKRVFSFARTLLNDRLEITFSSTWKDLANLAGRTIPMMVTIHLPGGGELSSRQAIWQAPDIGVPVYEGKCSVEESRAVLATPEAAETSGWAAVLRPVIVFAGISLLFFILWFWVPRFIWPDRYLGELQSFYYRRKWAGASRQTQPQRQSNTPERAREDAARGRPQPPPPIGFNGKSGPTVRERLPGEETYVQPRPDSGTRTRLDFDWTDKR